jgi:hypothetical protein
VPPDLLEGVGVLALGHVELGGQRRDRLQHPDRVVVGVGFRHLDLEDPETCGAVDHRQPHPGAGRVGHHHGPLDREGPPSGRPVDCDRLVPAPRRVGAQGPVVVVDEVDARRPRPESDHGLVDRVRQLGGGKHVRDPQQLRHHAGGVAPGPIGDHIST